MLVCFFGFFYRSGRVPDLNCPILIVFWCGRNASQKFDTHHNRMKPIPTGTFSNVSEVREQITCSSSTYRGAKVSAADNKKTCALLLMYIYVGNNY